MLSAISHNGVALSLVSGDLFATVLQTLVMAIACCGMLVPLAVIVYIIYFFVSLPLRRQERARFFLHLIETGFTMNRRPEEVITSISNSRDSSLGARIHLLAAHIRSGFTLGDALTKVPRLLPPPVTAMLRVGEAIGDVRKVLPACRRLVTDGSSQTRAAQSYVYLMIFFVLPAIPVLMIFLQQAVLPKFKEIFAGILGSGGTLPDFSLLNAATGLAFVPLVVCLLLWLCSIAYVGGPQFVKWVDAGVFPLGDWLASCLPWSRTRMERDFSAMLGLLLDANVPEPRAVILAAQSTDNRFFMQRAMSVSANLSAGKKLADALALLDDRGEFKWRLDNASRGPAGFTAALEGWVEALDARAFQQEQTAAQLLTTSVVLFNGLVVGLFVVGIFQCLIHFVNIGLLW